ncbi:MAG: hypothetical protein LHV69_01150 [Elusimicrobia bacterium]|nr:hypothetical protein [Candidatus Obscuribacterium magneticum]
MNIADLIKTKIPPAYRTLIDEAGRLADERNQGAALVGGVVRDLAMGRAVYDTDLLLDHPAQPLVEQLAHHRKALVTSHERFYTFSLKFPDDLKMDVATAREETYPTPAVLPRVTPSTIDRDLKRRDFTINAMASYVNKNKYGDVLDPFNGWEDIKNKTIRILHPLSFRDDPTRLFRAARFAGRFGFNVDELTRQKIEDAKKENLAGLLSPTRRRHEMELIMRDECPLPALERLQEWDVLSALHPDWRLLPDHKSGLLASTAKTMDPNLTCQRWTEWFKPWGREKARDMMLSLGFEKKDKKEIARRLA